MRALLIVALAAMLAAGCGGSGGKSTSAGCGRIDPPPGSLTTVPAGTAVTDVCALVRRATDVVLASNDDATARRLVAAAPNIRVWQDRQLQFGEPCSGCPTTPLSIDQIRSDHPEWILRDAAGSEISGTLTPGGEPSQAMLDVGDVNYQGAWENALSNSLMKAPWAGTVVQVNNDSAPSAPAVDPDTGDVETHGDRVADVARALSLIRGALKTEGFSLIGDIAPLTMPVKGQIGSTDAVMVTGGSDWPTVLDYLNVAVDRDVGVWMTDESQMLPDADRTFGYATFLLAGAEPFSAYAPTSTIDPLYRVQLGKPLAPPTDHDGLWVRTFEQGAVAVNVGAAAATADLGSFGTHTLAPGHAVIATTNRTFT